MRGIAAVAVAFGLVVFSVKADVAVGGVAAVEFTKKCQDASKANIDGSWIRAELKASGSLKNSPLTGLVHLRLQPDFVAKTSDNKYNVQARQVYFKLPVSVLEILAGRWYDVYGQGEYYFGRYLHGVGKTGSGSMNTNYSVIDGLKLKLNITAIKGALQVAYLPKDFNFENTYLMAMFGVNPIEALKFTIAGNFQIQTLDDADPVNRMIVNCGVTILKDLGLGLFGEYAITDFNEATDNMWFLVGLTTKAGIVLDKIQAEFEIKNHRGDDPTTDGNLAWVVILQKKVLGLTLDLNVGADPTILGSKTAGDIGAIFRVTASF
jgi:hypothetical protein